MSEIEESSLPPAIESMERELNDLNLQMEAVHKKLDDILAIKMGYKIISVAEIKEIAKERQEVGDLVQLGHKINDRRSLLNLSLLVAQEMLRDVQGRKKKLFAGLNDEHIDQIKRWVQEDNHLNAIGLQNLAKKEFGIAIKTRQAANLILALREEIKYKKEESATGGNLDDIGSAVSDTVDSEITTDALIVIDKDSGINTNIEIDAEADAEADLETNIETAAEAEEDKGANEGYDSSLDAEDNTHDTYDSEENTSLTLTPLQIQPQTSPEPCAILTDTSFDNIECIKSADAADIDDNADIIANKEVDSTLSAETSAEQIEIESESLSLSSLSSLLSAPEHEAENPDNVMTHNNEDKDGRETSDAGELRDHDITELADQNNDSNSGLPQETCESQASLKYELRVHIGKQPTHLGYFDTALEAETYLKDHKAQDNRAGKYVFEIIKCSPSKTLPVAQA